MRLQVDKHDLRMLSITTLATNIKRNVLRIASEQSFGQVVSLLKNLVTTSRVSFFPLVVLIFEADAAIQFSLLSYFL